MAKRVVWTENAKKQRKDILHFWIEKTGSKNYSRKLSSVFKQRIKYISDYSYMGKATDFANTRVTAAGHFSIFYQLKGSQIIIVGIWDNRQDPNKLIKIL